MADQKETNYEILRFESPLDSDDINAGKKSALTDKLDYMLANWDSGLFKEPEGEETMDYLYGSDPVSQKNLRIAMVMPLQELHKRNLCGGMDAWPSVDDMIETGNHIYITKPDGTTVSYTDEFFRNPTIDRLRELEQSKKGRSYGSIMAAHLSLFLSEAEGRAQLKNVKQGFHGLNPAEKGTVVTILAPGCAPIAVNPYTKEEENLFDSKQSVIEKGKATLAEKEQLLSAQNKDLDLKNQELKKEEDTLQEKGGEPVLPDKPAEKNFFRRILCAFGFRHSASYLKQQEAYQAVVRERTEYRELQERIEKLKDEANTLKNDIQNTKTQIETAQVTVKETEKVLAGTEVYQLMTRVPDALSHAEAREKMLKVDKEIARAEKEAAAGEKEKKKTGALEKEILPKLMNLEAIDRIDKSALTPLAIGQTASMIDLIKEKQMLVLGKEILRVKGMSYRMSEALMDRREAEQYMKTMKSLSSMASDKKDTSLEDRKKAEEQYRKMKSRLAEVYDFRISESVKLFEETFGMKAEPENVQKVIDATGLEKQVKDRIDLVDRPSEADGKRYQLPKVNSRNCGAMTMLLMSGIKTAISEGMIKVSGPDYREVSQEAGEKQIAKEKAEAEKAQNDLRADIRGLM